MGHHSDIVILGNDSTQEAGQAIELLVRESIPFAIDKTKNLSLSVGRKKYKGLESIKTFIARHREENQFRLR